MADVKPHQLACDDGIWVAGLCWDDGMRKDSIPFAAWGLKSPTALPPGEMACMQCGQCRVHVIRTLLRFSYSSQ